MAIMAVTGKDHPTGGVRAKQPTPESCPQKSALAPAWARFGRRCPASGRIAVMTTMMASWP